MHISLPTFHQVMMEKNFITMEYHQNVYKARVKNMLNVSTLKLQECGTCIEN